MKKKKVLRYYPFYEMVFTEMKNAKYKKTPQNWRF
jgi:hypothetical protein